MLLTKPKVTCDANNALQTLVIVVTSAAMLHIWDPTFGAFEEKCCCSIESLVRDGSEVQRVVVSIKAR